jgi:hypothetical protein
MLTIISSVRLSAKPNMFDISKDNAAFKIATQTQRHVVAHCAYFSRFAAGVLDATSWISTQTHVVKNASVRPTLGTVLGRTDCDFKCVIIYFYFSVIRDSL